jgi:hypothetical protein
LADLVTLNGAVIERLIAALRAQGAPMVGHLNPGLSDQEIDALVRPLGISLPAEAKEWWGYANGVPRGAAPNIDLSPSWSWAPLEEIVQECREMRAIGSEDVLPGEPSMFADTWLPIVKGDGMLVIDTTQPAIAPVYTVDWHVDDPDVPYSPILPSLGVLITTWARALEERAIWYDGDRRLFHTNAERLDALGIATALI